MQNHRKIFYDIFDPFAPLVIKMLHLNAAKFENNSFRGKPQNVTVMKMHHTKQPEG